MAYEMKPNTGSLFKNDRKEKDTHPSHTGTALIDGKEYWIDAWVNEKNGQKYFSLKFKEKTARGSGTPPGAAAQGEEPDAPWGD